MEQQQWELLYQGMELRLGQHGLYDDKVRLARKTWQFRSPSFITVNLEKKLCQGKTQCQIEGDNCLIENELYKLQLVSFV